MNNPLITINYFSNNRKEFSDIIFYFMNKIKLENILKIKINILTTHEDVSYWEEKIRKYNYSTLLVPQYNIITFKNGFNYTEKLQFTINQDTKYSIKLDEDCVINNYIWDFLIENTAVLDNDENLLLSPILSTTIPTCDEFIKGFLNDDEINIINNCFLKQVMPNGLFGVNYESLNEFTINANKWDYKAYYNALKQLSTETKGMHPMRISYDAQIKINEFILNRYYKLLEKNDYSLFEIDSPYFTNNLFMIKTSTWKHIIDSNGGIYDEIPITRFRNATSKKYLFINKGYGVHSFFNTCYGGQNKWNIGHPDAEKNELEFMKNLTNKIII